MIVKNESENLARCLASVQGFVDEIIIVDTGSQDNTKEIALSFGSKVYDYEWNDDFASARNYANSYANGEWILFVDADEELVLHEDIRLFLKSQSTSILCCTICIYNTKTIDLAELEDKSYFFRIFRSESNLCFKGKLHEQLFYKERPLLKEELGCFNQDRGFLKHYGDLSNKYLTKIREFYIPMLERIASKESLDFKLLAHLNDYYHIVEDNEKILGCNEIAIEKLMPHIMSSERPLDFIYVPTWLNNICNYYFNEKDLETLLVILPVAVNWCNQFPPILNLTGKTMLSLGFYLAALPYFQSSIECFATGTYQSSALFEGYCESVEFFGAEALYLESICYIELKEWERAIASLNLCLSLNSNFPDAKEKLLWIENKMLEIQA